MNQGQGNLLWIHDSGPATLTLQLLMRILYIFVYYHVLERKSSFQSKYDCCQHFGLSVNTFSDNRSHNICWLVSFMYLHRLRRQLNFLWFYKGHHLQKRDFLICIFARTDIFFSPSVNNLLLKPLHSQHCSIFR